MSAHRRQRGTTTVELAVAGAAALMLLIGCIEVGRLLFVWNTIGEATRRAARLAAVCPLNDGAITQAALLSSTPGATRSPYLSGLAASNIVVEYLGTGGAPTGVFADVRYVSVAITGYQHTLLIPFLARTLTVPPFRTTLPSESLGYVPETGAFVCAPGSVS